VIRHLSIVSALAECGRPLTAQQVSKLTNLPRATTYKVIDDLVREGWLVSEGSPRKFRPSLRVVHLGLRALGPLHARRVVLPHSIDCARQLDKRCSIAFYEGGEVVYTDGFQRVGENIVPYAQTARVHCLTTASGKALLAFQPDAEVRRVVCESPLPLRLSGTAADSEEVLEELNHIRSVRYAVADGEYDPRSKGIAAPVFAEGGTVALSMGLDAPSGLTPTFVESVLAPLRAAAGRASLELGYFEEHGLLA
jgi:IclR family transcriptional regulator, KDG regulon repressor